MSITQNSLLKKALSISLAFLLVVGFCPAPRAWADDAASSSANASFSSYYKYDVTVGDTLITRDGSARVEVDESNAQAVVKNNADKESVYVLYSKYGNVGPLTLQPGETGTLDLTTLVAAAKNEVSELTVLVMDQTGRAGTGFYLVFAQDPAPSEEDEAIAAAGQAGIEIADGEYGISTQDGNFFVMDAPINTDMADLLQAADSNDLAPDNDAIDFEESQLLTNQDVADILDELVLQDDVDEANAAIEEAIETAASGEAPSAAASFKDFYKYDISVGDTLVEHGAISHIPMGEGNSIITITNTGNEDAVFVIYSDYGDIGPTVIKAGTSSSIDIRIILSIACSNATEIPLLVMNQTARAGMGFYVILSDTQVPDEEADEQLAEGTEGEAAESEAVESEATEPEVAEPEATDSEATEPETAESAEADEPAAAETPAVEGTEEETTEAPAAEEPQAQEAPAAKTLETHSPVVAVTPKAQAPATEEKDAKPATTEAKSSSTTQQSASSASSSSASAPSASSSSAASSGASASASSSNASASISTSASSSASTKASSSASSASASAASSAKPQAAKPQIAKTTLSSVTATASGMKVSWQKNATAAGYYLYRSADGGAYTKVTTIFKNSTTSYTDKGAKSNGVKYSYKIVAYQKVGATEYTGDYSAVKTGCFLSTPAISKVTNSAAKQATVTWKQNAKATGYQIKYTTDGKSKTVSVGDAKTAQKVVNGLSKGKTYKVQVRTCKKIGSTKYYSAWSAAKSVKIAK